MDLKRLIKLGYFPAELPPPFQTAIFAAKIDAIEASWNAFQARVDGLPNPTQGSPHPRVALTRKMKESRWVSYSVPRFAYVRRLLAIPNPFHQTILSRAIADNWQQICDVFDKSKISSTKPIENLSSSRAVDRNNSYKKFVDDCVIGSFSSRYELRTDISRFYPSLYTHAIPWAIHTKPVAKALERDQTLLGNILDKTVRNGNSRQTFGIPIGPDTSLILAELVTCSIDSEIQSLIIKPGVRAFRYIDDYRIFCTSRGDAEAILTQLQHLLNNYELHINEAKTEILETPYPFVERWASALQAFDFGLSSTAPRAGQISKQRGALKDFVSTALDFAQQFPDKWVITYAFQIISDQAVYEANWDLYVSLLFKMALVEPNVLAELAIVLVSNRARVNSKMVKEFCNVVLVNNLPNGHHGECSWALWLCKEFGVKVNKPVAEAIFRSGDVVTILIALDLKSKGLIAANVSTQELSSEMTPDSLMSDRWLLTYEAMCKGWVDVPRKNPVNANEYFRILKRMRVSFYNDSLTVTPRAVKVPPGALPY